MKTGFFVKTFTKFEDGLEELKKVSFSAKQALEFNNPGSPYPERNAVTALALNAAMDRPTGNGVDWGRCAIEIRPNGVEYTTSGGLTFGWVVDSSDYQRYREFEEGGNFWMFYIEHPDGEKATPESTLRQSCLEAGWEEKRRISLHPHLNVL